MTMAPVLDDPFGFAAGVGVASSASLGATGCSARTSLAGLSWRSPLKADWRIMPAPVQPANSISATSTGLTQFQSLLFARRILARERAFVGDVDFQLLQQVLRVARVEAGSDLADMDQMIAAVHASNEGA